MTISFQLYSARNFPPLSAVSSTLSDLGYSNVEGYGDQFEAVPDLMESLETSKLSMPSAHFGLDQLMQVRQVSKIARDLGINLLICPYVAPEDRPQTAFQWIKLAQTLQYLAETYAQSGYSFAWHNHDFEFVPLATGEFPMDLLLKNAPDLSWQFDVAWSAKAAQDPLDWIKKYGKRIVSVHVKDIAPEGTCEDEDGWADLGQGIMDWQGILSTLAQHTDCNSFVVEHDNPNDLTRFATRSISALKNLGVE